MNLTRAAIFTLLVPGTVAMYIPYWILASSVSRLELGVLHFVGFPLIITGATLYFMSVALFLVKGGGTPAIWFTKPLKFLLGEEPGKVVLNGLYARTRNPMYVGVVTIVCGEGIYFRSWELLMYALTLWILFHLVVVFIEEPHLRRKYGRSYEEYLQRVPRWLGLRRKPVN